MAANNATTSIYMAQRDSLGNQSAYMQLRARGVNSVSNQLVFGFVEPTGGRQVFVTVTTNSVGFATFTEATGVWTMIPGRSTPRAVDSAPTATTSTRLRKIGTTSYRLCVDGTQRLNMPYATTGLTSASFNTSSVVFGTKGIGGGGGGASSRWTSVAYKIGSDNGGC